MIKVRPCWVLLQLSVRLLSSVCSMQLNCWRQTDVSTGTPLVVRTALTDNTLPRPDKGRMVSLDRVEPRARKTGI